MIVQWNALENNPILILQGKFTFAEDTILSISSRIVTESWGSPTFIYGEIWESEMPTYLELSFLSITTLRLYKLMIPLDAIDEKELGEDNFLIGLSPYGDVSIWLCGTDKSRIYYKGKGVEINGVEELLNKYLPLFEGNSIKDYQKKYLNKNPIVKDCLEKNGLPPRDLFDNYMKQFTFRYQVAFEKWNGEKWEKYGEDEAAPEFDYIEEALYDGTHDKLHDGGLMKYHEAGKPKKLKVQFHVGGDTKDGKKRPVQEYSVYFWFEDERIREVFDRFYGAHPDTKTDFIIRIDAAQNKYGVAMYRYGLKEPVVLSEDTYQLIVFRNKFECYRSENYNQQRGAWIW